MKTLRALLIFLSLLLLSQPAGARLAVRSLDELGRSLCEKDDKIYPIANQAQTLAKEFYAARLKQEGDTGEFLSDQTFLWPAEAATISGVAGVPTSLPGLALDGDDYAAYQSSFQSQSNLVSREMSRVTDNARYALRGAQATAVVSTAVGVVSLGTGLIAAKAAGVLGQALAKVAYGAAGAAVGSLGGYYGSRALGADEVTAQTFAVIGGAVLPYFALKIPLGGAAKTLPKGERLGMVYDRVRGAPGATTAEEAMGQMHGTLDAVEDAFSGVPKATNPGLKPDGRMYPVQPDRIVTGADGAMTATSRGHITTYGPNGSITVTDRATGAVVFHKPGGG